MLEESSNVQRSLSLRNIIDVAALDSHNLEQHEYVEKARQYIQKTQAVQPVLLSKYHRLSAAKTTPGVLKDIPAVESLLKDPPISVEDYQLMMNGSNRLSKAIGDIHVEHREDLVVHFAIP